MASDEEEEADVDFRWDRAADWRMRERVWRMARRFLPDVFLGGFEGCFGCRCSIVVVVVVALEESIAAKPSTPETEDFSKRSIAARGMTPPGKEEDKRIGSSLHSGHISDPFP